jgi:N-acetylmuramic acid 6-phosphate (MurNAc-6-P) etherase
MANVRRKNSKLVERAVTVVARGAGLGRVAARRALNRADGDVSIALVMSKTGAGRAEAARALTLSRGNLREAIARLR